MRPGAATAVWETKVKPLTFAALRRGAAAADAPATPGKAGYVLGLAMTMLPVGRSRFRPSRFHQGQEGEPMEYSMLLPLSV